VIVKEEKKPEVQEGKGGQEPWQDLTNYFVEPDVLAMIPKDIAVKYTLLPLYMKGQVLHLVMADPKNVTSIDQVRKLTKVRAVVPHAQTKQVLLEAIDRNYGSLDQVSDIVQEIEQDRIDQGVALAIGDMADLEAAAEQAPIIKLVNHVLMRAVQDKVSDIHFEPDDKILRVRYRKDGVLNESYTFQKQLENAVIARIKITSGMDIAEKRKPQDGRIRIVLESKKIERDLKSIDLEETGKRRHSENYQR